MRLNRVELFYALIATIGSESRHCLRGRGGHMHAVCMQRWLDMARPPAGAFGHGLAMCKGQPPAGAAAARDGHGRLRPAHRGGRQRPARMGQSAATSPATSRGGDAGCKGGRPLVGQLPTAKGSRRLHWSSGGGGAVRVKEG
ncbi:hypothetical protein GW17_00061690 [Ensete ventricosum]|nr:hypothetical protein GW17_00061690 [Ensete ventricosum]RZS28375.1 hypothetical protein BHM03_00061955 [Ensete ventricosum]